MASSFSARSTTEDVLRGRDLSGQNMLITGCNAGIGFETARALAAHGAHVIVACRDRAKAEQTAARIRARACRFHPSALWASTTAPPTRSSTSRIGRKRSIGTISARRAKAPFLASSGLPTAAPGACSAKTASLGCINFLKARRSGSSTSVNRFLEIFAPSCSRPTGNGWRFRKNRAGRSGI